MNAYAETLTVRQPKPTSNHIRIHEDVPSSESIAGIRITTGNFHTRKQDTAHEYQSLTARTTARIIPPDSPQKTERIRNIQPSAPLTPPPPSCPITTGAGTLAAKHLAGALRFYLEDKGKDSQVITDIYNASIETGADFGLMVMAALLESNLGQNTKAANSSARGLFQYIDSTWLILIHKYGNRIGHIKESESIELAENNEILKIKESSRITKESILSIRFNNRIASLIKGYQMQEEQSAIATLKQGKSLSAADHYIAHMLGLTLAREFYKLKQTQSSIKPAQSRTALMREAAKLNPYFFYASHGARTRPLRADEVYARFTRRVNSAIHRLRAIEDEYGLGKSADFLRKPCDIN